MSGRGMWRAVENPHGGGYVLAFVGDAPLFATRVEAMAAARERNKAPAPAAADNPPPGGSPKPSPVPKIGSTS